jgi:hypothetical protein
MRAMLLVVGGVIVASVVAVGNGLLTYASGGGPAGDVQATTVDHAIRMPPTLSAGRHTIGLTNNGTTGPES